MWTEPEVSLLFLLTKNYHQVTQGNQLKERPRNRVIHQRHKQSARGEHVERDLFETYVSAVAL